MVVLIQEFIREYRMNRVSINYQSRPVILFLTTLAGSLGFTAIFCIRSLIHLYKDYVYNRKLNRPLLIRQSSSILKKSGARELYVPKPKDELTLKRIVIPKPNQDLYALDKYLYKNFDKRLHDTQSSLLFSSRFLSQIALIWRILIPKYYLKNTYLLLSQCFFLVLRTWLSLLVAKLDGQIVKNLIGGNGRKFARDLIYWLLIAFPASYTNAAIKYLTNRLALSFRANLTRYIHDMYLDNKMVYYKIAFNSPTLVNIDQYITNDVEKFCSSICSLFSSMGKPAIDLVFFLVYLRDALGTGAIIGIFANYFLTATVLKRYTPSFGKLSKKRTQLEGTYYNQHLNIITNSEEIGFYKGSVTERNKLLETFDKLMKHINKEIDITFTYNILEDYVLKYTWSAWGYIFAGLPVFLDDFLKYVSGEGTNSTTAITAAPTISTSTTGVTNNNDTATESRANERQNMRQFIINKRLLLSLADAGSRLMYSLKDISELTGYTDRVFELLTNLHKVHSPRFQYGANDKVIAEEGGSCINGTIQNDYRRGVRFENIPIIIPLAQGPEGTNLITNNLSFQVLNNWNLLILGHNGCGKTSIARIMAGLWPLYYGLLLKPNDDDIYYLPQKCYFTQGNLREQIIYPYSYNDMLEMGYNDDHLFHILREVKLEYLLTREGNFNVRKDWKDVFSGGEKQRILIARVLFKKPKLVVLDELTNAVSTDVEGYLFELLERKKIRYITLSHRPLLMKYHDLVLEIDEVGSWSLHDLTSEENLQTIDKEISEIESKLSQVDQWEKRKQVVELYLDGKKEE